MGGLSFFCPDMPEEPKRSFKVGILCEGAKNFSNGNINCKKLMLRHSGLNNHESKKKFSVEFDALNAMQESQLEQIIQNCAIS